MPGVVKKVQCEEGDSVAQGTLIVTLEAMKMQNPLFAPMTGRVSRQTQAALVHKFPHQGNGLNQQYNASICKFISLYAASLGIADA